MLFLPMDRASSPVTTTLRRLSIIFPNVLANFKVNGSVVGTTQWIGTYLCVFMMVRECFSCVENIQAIYPIFPTSFVRRLKDFNDKGEYIKKD